MAFRHTIRTVRDAALGAGDSELYVNIQSAHRTVRPSGGGMEWAWRAPILFTVHKVSDDSDVTNDLSSRVFELMSEDAIDYMMTFEDTKLVSEGIVVKPFEVAI